MWHCVHFSVKLTATQDKNNILKSQGWLDFSPRSRCRCNSKWARDVELADVFLRVDISLALFPRSNTIDGAKGTYSTVCTVVLRACRLHMRLVFRHAAPE